MKKHKVNVHANVRKSKNIALLQRRFDAYVVGASGPNLSVSSASAAGITLYHCPRWVSREGAGAAGVKRLGH